jgi:DNA mismatch repair protein MutH
MADGTAYPAHPPDTYDPCDPESIERYAKRLIGRTLREALREDKGLQPSPGKGSFGTDLEKLYFGLTVNSESRPDFELAGLELKSSSLRRIDKGRRLVPKERVSLSMIDYAGIEHETWETSAFLRKNRHILFVFYEHDNDADSPLDCVIKCVGRWTIADECMPLLEADWVHIRRLLVGYGDGALHGGLTNNLEAAKKGAKGATARRAFAFKPPFVKKYVLPRISWTQPILPPTYDDSTLDALSGQISGRFEPFLGRTAEEIATELDVPVGGRGKSMHADITKRILGVDPDNAIEDVNVRTVRLDFGKTKPRESISFPAFKYLDLVEQTWETSDLHAILLKPFLFVVFEELEPGGRRGLEFVKLWRMPQADLEGPVRHVWEETVRRILGGRADHLPRMSENPVCHVRPHGRDSRDTLPTPKNGELVKRCFWLGNAYVGAALDAHRNSARG